ncbi:DUF6713 family protein [Methanococcoides sp. FTZ1]|uniref:DUF6713 family protein n=1 Tax=Methanococcoides sp. FTZ1 TaxID=3439061 RepID=UPI003F87F9FA
MSDILFWVYLVNSILLIDHEIDSAYWEEWKLFRLPGGITGFLLIHIPVLFFVLYGLVLIYQQSYMGLICSLILSLSGIFAFTAHMYFISNGRDEFKTTISLLILASTLIVSVVQAYLTINLILK